MKKALLICSITILSFACSGIAFAQSKLPLFGMFLKSSHYKVKDKTSGEFGEWINMDIKNWLLGIYTQDLNGIKKVDIINSKNGKLQKYFYYEKLEAGDEGDAQFIKLTGAKDMMGDPLTIVFYYDPKVNSIRLSSWIKLQLVYPNMIREFEASNTK